MRWLFLAIVVLSLPLLASYARKGDHQRDKLLLVLGALLWAAGTLKIDAAVITWPVWPGTSRGIIFSFVDAIAAALLITRRGRAAWPPFLILIALFAIPMIAASFVASVKMASLFSLFQYAQIIFLFVALSHELKRASAVKGLLSGLAIGLIVQSGYVIQQKLTGVVQAKGTFFHQNVLGIAVQLGVMPLFAAVLEGERSKIVYGGVIAGCICVAGGGSRAATAFFALALALTVLLSVIRRSTPRKWKIIGLSLAAAAVFVPLALGTLEARFGTREMTATDESRIAFERAATAIAADHPLGVGPNNFVTVNNTGGYAAKAGIQWGGGLLDKPVHNAYLLARSETGWAGQIALVLLLAGVALAAYRTAFRERKAPAVGIALGSAVGITTVAIHSNYEFAWYLPEVQRLFFVNAAVIAGCMAIAAETRIRNRKPRRVPAALSTSGPLTAGGPSGIGE